MAQRIDTTIFGASSTWLQPNSPDSSYTSEKYPPKTWHTIAREKNLKNIPKSLYAWGINGLSAAGAMVCSNAHHSAMGVSTVKRYQNPVKQSSKTNVGITFLSYATSSNITWQDVYGDADLQGTHGSYADIWIYVNDNIKYINNDYNTVIWRGITLDSSAKENHYINEIPTYLTGTSYSTYEYGWHLNSIIPAVSYDYQQYVYMPVVRLMSAKNGATIYKTVSIDSDFTTDITAYVSSISGSMDEDWRVIGMELVPSIGTDGNKTSMYATGAIQANMPCIFPASAITDIPVSEHFKTAYRLYSADETGGNIPDTVAIDHRPTSAITWGLTGQLFSGTSLEYSNTSNYDHYGVPLSENFPTVGSDRYVGKTSTWLPLNINRSGFCCDSFYKMSTHAWYFDDVAYKWSLSLAISGLGFIDTDTLDYDTFPAESYQWRLVPTLKILDAKGADYFTAVANALKHEIAFTGLPFILKNTDYNALWDSASIYLPVFDSHMITTGEYKNTDKSDMLNYTWRNVYESDSLALLYDADYQPKSPDSPEKDSGYLNNKKNAPDIGFKTGTTAYAMSESEFTNFIQAINELYTGATDDTDLKIDFKGSNPLDYVVNALGYPFSIASWDASSTTVQLGPVTLTGVTATKQLISSVNPNTSQIIYGDIEIAPYYEDFRDYAPYTTIQLYIPFCGTIDLDPAYYIGHSVYLDIVYNYKTGSATARIYRDNTLDKAVNGSVATKLPLTALSMGEYQNQIRYLESSLKNQELQQGVNAASAGVALASILLAPETGGLSLLAGGAGLLASGASLAKGARGMQETEYKLTHTQPAISSTTASDSYNSFNLSQLKPMLLIKRAKMLDSYNSDAYGKTVGFACCYQSTVGTESGYTACSDILCNDISKTVDGVTLSPTADEVEMLKTMFKGGVIL